MFASAFSGNGGHAFKIEQTVVCERSKTEKRKKREEKKPKRERERENKKKRIETSFGEQSSRYWAALARSAVSPTDKLAI